MADFKTFTFETRINQRDNSDLISYVKDYSVLYCKMLRYTWHRYKKGGKYPVKKQEFNSLLQKKFGVSKRMAGAVLSEVEGIYNSQYQLKWYELSQLKIKIDSLYKRKAQINGIIHSLKDKELSESQRKYYRGQKQRIFYINQKLNKLKQKKQDIIKVIESKRMSICFGSKRLFKAQYFLKENNFTSHKVWLEHFRKQRDNHCLFIGSKDECACNQLLQVSRRDDSVFKIQLRKNTLNREYLKGICNFKYGEQNILDTLKTHTHGISYRFKFQEGKCYLQAMVSLEKEKSSMTRKDFGAIGLDYNNGFIELAETNSIGNLIGLEHYALRFHGCGDKATSEIREVVSRIVNSALSKGRDIVIEDLDFRRKKSEIQKAKTDKGVWYNKMIHFFDYSRYTGVLENCCFRKNVGLIKVNPAYTSQVAKDKYCGLKKLVVHQGASYVIARRGQGYIN